MEHLKYPIGKFDKTVPFDLQNHHEYMHDIASFPTELALLVDGMTVSESLQTYRPGSWTVAQVIHHCFDSHVNAYCRTKFALTETNPDIKPYAEALWADTPEQSLLHWNDSVQMLQGLHFRWHLLLSKLDAEDFEKSYFHPEHQRLIPLWQVVGMYSWHGRHHLAHIRLALNR